MVTEFYMVGKSGTMSRVAIQKNETEETLQHNEALLAQSAAKHGMTIERFDHDEQCQCGDCVQLRRK